jgi:glycosyltransferase involved in cell wall biosynthesis
MPRFRRTFWPDHAELLALPGPNKRTGSQCDSRVTDTVHSGIVSIVTESWSDASVSRLEAMAKSLENQSYHVSRWWVLFLSPNYAVQKTIRTLRRHGAIIVHGDGVDLVQSIEDQARASRLGIMPVNVLVDENFNAVFEHTAIEKFIWALEGHGADAVSSWSVSYNPKEKTQHFAKRTSQDRYGAIMMRTDSAQSWKLFQGISQASPAPTLYCDRYVVIIPEYLYWDDMTAHQLLDDRSSASFDCELRTDPVQMQSLPAASTLRMLMNSGFHKVHQECNHGASLALMVPWLEFGGADQFNVNLVRNMAGRYNVHVVVMTTTEGSTHPLFGDIASATEDVFHLDHLIPPAHTRPKRLTMVDAVAYLSRTRGVDVLLLSNSEPGYMSLAALRRQLPAVTFADYVHSISLDWINGGYGRYSLNEQRWLDHTFVSSNGLRAWMQTEGHPLIDAFGRPTLHTVYVGVDASECRRLSMKEKAIIRNKYRVDEQKLLIVFPARMSPEKNPGRFFAIIERVLTAHPEVSVIAVGGGALLGELRANVTRAGLEKRVISTGALAHSDALEILQAADIMMLTSNYEGISLSIFEAMSAGVVPFSTDVGAQNELVTPDTGFLIPLDRNVIEAYASALNKLLDDPQQIERMGEAAHSKITSKFDVALLPVHMRRAMCPM